MSVVRVTVCQTACVWLSTNAVILELVSVCKLHNHSVHYLMSALAMPWLDPQNDILQHEWLLVCQREHILHLLRVCKLHKKRRRKDYTFRR